jgi:hypothetical protein
VDPQFAGDVASPHGLKLSAASVLIDRGLSPSGSSTRFDAAGRPRVSGKAIDVGAYELADDSTLLVWEAESVVHRDSAITIRFPVATGLDGLRLRVEFSLNGRDWSTVAKRDGGAASWQTAHGLEVEISAESIDVTDGRALTKGMFRGVASP